MDHACPSGGTLAISDLAEDGGFREFLCRISQLLAPNDVKIEGCSRAGCWTSRVSGGQGLGAGGARWEQGQCRLRFEGHGSRQESVGSGSCRPWGVRLSPPGDPGSSSWRGHGVDKWWHHRHGHHVGTAFVPCSLTSGSPPAWDKGPGVRGRLGFGTLKR